MIVTLNRLLLSDETQNDQGKPSFFEKVCLTNAPDTRVGRVGVV